MFCMLSYVVFIFMYSVFWVLYCNWQVVVEADIDDIDITLIINVECS